MFTKDQIQKAANEQAVKILGEDQARKNKMAAKSISEDFKDGINWVFEQIKDRLDDGDSYRMPGEIDYHALGFDLIASLSTVSEKS